MLRYLIDIFKISCSTRAVGLGADVVIFFLWYVFKPFLSKWSNLSYVFFSSFSVCSSLSLLILGRFASLYSFHPDCTVCSCSFNKLNSCDVWVSGWLNGLLCFLVLFFFVFVFVFFFLNSCARFSYSIYFQEDHFENLLHLQISWASATFGFVGSAFEISSYAVSHGSRLLVVCPSKVAAVTSARLPGLLGSLMLSPL